jgi:hypothetical protein
LARIKTAGIRAGPDACTDIIAAVAKNGDCAV